MKHFRPTSRQTQQIFAALILTGILSLGAGTTFVNAAAANSTGSPQGTVGLKQRNRELPRSVVNAVRREIARAYRIPPGQLNVVSYTQQSWSDSCLGLRKPDEVCGQVFIENGWRVVMSDGSRTWIARSDGTGRVVRLEGQRNSNSNLPDSVANAVLREASQSTGLRTSGLRIVGAQQIQGSSSCLGIPSRRGERCTKDLVPLWQVTVEARQQRLVYHSNMNGSRIRLNEEASNIGNADLPQSVADAVLQFASQDLGVSSSQLQIIKAQQQTWSDGCLGLPRPTERCMGVLTPGWQVSVEGRKTVQVYRTDDSGSRIRSEAIAEQLPSDRDLPNSVAQAVLRDVVRRSNLSSSQLRIVQADRQDWPNGCLGLAERGVFCTQAIVPGWRVTVEGSGTVFAYRTNESGSVIKLESGATQGNSGAVPIPQSELPPPLREGVVFRAFEGGGITGRTTETILTSDGRVIRRFTNSMIMAPTQMHQISRQELRQFQQLLEQHNFAQFDRLAYPAPRGAADYITVTLTSQAGTTRYADMGQDGLPEPLQAVVQAWGQIANRR
jgi:hypothetical protein